MSKPVILTGLRANNDLHIGNYFGALLPIVDMAKNRSGDYQVNLFVPDLHSFTTPIDHSQLQQQIMHNLRLFAAAGLPLHDENINIYRQSYIPAHSELTWILDCFTGFGEMSRMTQFKDKAHDTLRELLQKTSASKPHDDPYEDEFIQISMSLIEQHKNSRDKDLYEDLLKFASTAHETLASAHRQHAKTLGKLRDELKDAVASAQSSVGLFNYPVLMAADILLYGAQYVPVGDDQTQHLEYTRDIAERMNNKFGELFVVPEPVKKQHEFFGKDQGLRIKDLQNPSRKMSKSEESGRGVIFLGDNPDEAAKKIMSAETDSVGVVHYDVEKQPGISNLLQIHALLSGETLDAVIEHHDGQASYGDLKKEVAEQVKEFLTDFQARLAAVDDGELAAKLQSSEAQMNDVANKTLLRVQQAVGLR